MNQTNSKSMFVPIYVGYFFNNEYVKEVELLRANGTAEKIFTEKLSEKPYTWMGNVVAAGTKSIAGTPTGTVIREEYEKTGGISAIPMSVLSMPLADVNTLLVEIHRKVWKGLIKNQEVLCRYCTKKVITDIDLNKITLDEETSEIAQETEQWDALVVNLKNGWVYSAPTLMGTNRKAYEELNGLVFNRFTFRIPTLMDAIRNEKYAQNTIDFWRRIAFDCLMKVECIEKNEEGEEIPGVELPVDAKNATGMNLFNKILDTEDLSDIREALRDKLPTLPFDYKAPCGCPKKMEIPVTMEATNFFSE